MSWLRWTSTPLEIGDARNEPRFQCVVAFLASHIWRSDCQARYGTDLVESPMLGQLTRSLRNPCGRAWADE
jgi:hypothetical protein